MADFGLAAQIGRGGGGMAGPAPVDPANRMMQMLQLQQLQQNMMLAREQGAREAALAPLRMRNLEQDVRGSSARADVSTTQAEMLRSERDKQQRELRVNRGMIDVMDRVDRGILDLSTPDGFNAITDPEVRMAARRQLADIREAAAKAEKANLDRGAVQRAAAYQFVDRFGDGITGQRQYSTARSKILSVDPTAAEFLPDNYNADNAERLRSFVRDRKTSIQMIGGVPVMVTEGSPIGQELTIQRAPPPGAAPAAFGGLPSPLAGPNTSPAIAALGNELQQRYGDMSSGIIGQRLPAGEPVSAPAGPGAAAPAVAPQARDAIPASQFVQERKTAEAEKTRATETAKAAVVSEERRKGAGEVLKAINSAKIEDLITESTSGQFQRQVASVPAYFGVATSGMKKIGQLGTIKSDLTRQILGGKLGGGISDADVRLVNAGVADIDNPDIPAEQRLAAFRQLKNNLEALAAGKEIEVATPTRGGASGGAVDTSNKWLR